MELLIIIAICFVGATAACVWCVRSQNKIEARFKQPKRKRKPGKVVQFKMDKKLAQELDKALSLDFEIIQSC